MHFNKKAIVSILVLALVAQSTNALLSTDPSQISIPSSEEIDGSSSIEYGAVFKHRKIQPIHDALWNSRHINFDELPIQESEFEGEVSDSSGSISVSISDHSRIETLNDDEFIKRPQVQDADVMAKEAIKNMQRARKIARGRVPAPKMPAVPKKPQVPRKPQVEEVEYVIFHKKFNVTIEKPLQNFTLRPIDRPLEQKEQHPEFVQQLKSNNNAKANNVKANNAKANNVKTNNAKANNAKANNAKANQKPKVQKMEVGKAENIANQTVINMKQNAKKNEKNQFPSNFKASQPHTQQVEYVIFHKKFNVSIEMPIHIQDSGLDVTIHEGAGNVHIIRPNVGVNGVPIDNGRININGGSRVIRATPQQQKVDKMIKKDLEKGELPTEPGIVLPPQEEDKKGKKKSSSSKKKTTKKSKSKKSGKKSSKKN